MLISLGSFADTIPIRLDTVNPHYFNFRGEPTILITSAEQYSAVQNLDFDYIPYLDELESHGMNYTRIFCGVFINGMAESLPRRNSGTISMPIGSPLYPDTINAELTKGLISPWARSDDPGYIGGGNKFDLDTWDTLYFYRLTDYITEASQRGIVVEVTFYCGYGGAQYWQYSPMNVINNINDVGKFGGDHGPYDTAGNNIGHKYPLTLIAAGDDGLLEYQETMIEKHLDELQYYDNVFFEVCNEPYYVNAGNTEVNQNGEHCGTRVGVSSEWQAHMVKLMINKMDTMPHKFLLAQNIDHFYEKVWLVDDTVSPINMDDFRDIYPEIDILNFHYGAKFERYVDRAVNYNYALNRVISMDENGYEGGEDHTYRKEAWNYIIGGGGIFNNLDLSYTTNGYEDGQPTNPSKWYGGSPGLHEQYGILTEFVHSLDFLNMEPNNFLPDSGEMIINLYTGLDTVNIRCLANEGVEYAVYVEGGTKVSITFDLPAGDYKAEWINTKSRDADTNIIIEKTEFIYHEGDTVTITSPDYSEEDIALHLISFTGSPPIIDTIGMADPDTIPLLGTTALTVVAHDPDGEPLTYSWSKITGPDTVFFSVNDTTFSDQTLASFVSDGSYTLRVSVFDRKDTVTSDVDVLVRPQHFQTAWSEDTLQPMEIIFDTAIFNGKSLVLGDEIGVFDTTAIGSEICVGVGMVVRPITKNDTLIIIASEDDPNTTEKDGFIAGRNIICKVWKNSYQQEFDSVVNTYDDDHDIVFTANGKAKAELVSTNYISQGIDLTSGWNIHSFAVMPDLLDMEHIHGDLIDSDYLVKIINESGGFMQYIPGYGWLNTLGDASSTEGYYIKVNTDATLDVSVQKIQTPFTIPLTSGWNIHGYPLFEPQDAIDAYQQLIDDGELIKVIDEAGGFIQFIPGFGWLNTIYDLETGEGYYIKVNANTSLILDYPVAKSSYIKPPVLVANYFKKAFVNNPYFPMNILITEINMDGLNVHEGDEIAVYDGDLCVGTAVVTESEFGYLASIGASMDDPTTDEIDGFVVGNDITFKYYSSGTMVSEKVIPTAILGSANFESLGTYVGALKGTWVDTGKPGETDFNFRIIPNPVDSDAKLQISIPEEGQIQIKIFDINGLLMETKSVQYSNSGSHEHDLDIQHLRAGIYVVKLTYTANAYSQTKFERFVKL